MLRKSIIMVCLPMMCQACGTAPPNPPTMSDTSSGPTAAPPTPVPSASVAPATAPGFACGDQMCSETQYCLDTSWKDGQVGPGHPSRPATKESRCSDVPSLAGYGCEKPGADRHVTCAAMTLLSHSPNQQK
jgi:hypothetical protein